MGNCCGGQGQKNKDERSKLVKEQEEEKVAPPRQAGRQEQEDSDEKIQSSAPESKYESNLKDNKLFGKFNGFLNDYMNEPADQKNSFLEFDELKQVYKAMLMWNKILFTDRKSDLTQDRRVLQKESKTTEYKALCALIQKEEEDHRVKVLDDIMNAIKISESVFQQALMKYMQEPEKFAQIQKLKEFTEETAFNLESGKYEPLPLGEHIDKKEALAVHTKLHELSLAHLGEVKKMPLENLQAELGILQMVLSDMLFDAVGVESYDLDAATERLNLEEDAEYQILCGHYQTAVAALKLGQ